MEQRLRNDSAVRFTTLYLGPVRTNLINNTILGEKESRRCRSLGGASAMAGGSWVSSGGQQPQRGRERWVVRGMLRGP